MRITLSDPDIITLTEYIEEFMLMKQGKEIAELTIRDYQRTFRAFLSASHNSVDYETLKSDVSSFGSIMNSCPPVWPPSSSAGSWRRAPQRSGQHPF